jgi:hypothetical protein
VWQALKKARVSVCKLYAVVGSNHVHQAMSFYDALLGAGGCFYGDVAKGHAHVHFDYAVCPTRWFHEASI